MAVIDKNGNRHVTYKQMIIWMVSLFLGLLTTAVIVATTLRSTDQALIKQHEITNQNVHNDTKILQQKTSEQLAELLQIVAVANEGQILKHERIDEILKEAKLDRRSLSQRIEGLRKRIENGI